MQQRGIRTEEDYIFGLFFGLFPYIANEAMTTGPIFLIAILKVEKVVTRPTGLNRLTNKKFVS